jgi:hypothetical protein
MGNVATNARSFLGRDFHMKAGMRYLIESFCRSSVDGAPDPISYSEIRFSARIMDMIFAQIGAQQQAETCVQAAAY